MQNPPLTPENIPLESRIEHVYTRAVSGASVAINGIRASISERRLAKASLSKSEAISDLAFVADIKPEVESFISDDQGVWDINGPTGHKHPNMPSAPPEAGPLASQAKTRRLMWEMQNGRFEMQNGVEVMVKTGKEVRAEYLLPPEKSTARKILSPEKDSTNQTPNIVWAGPERTRIAPKTRRQRELQRDTEKRLKEIGDERTAQGKRVKMFGSAVQTDIGQTGRDKRSMRKSNDKAYKKGSITLSEYEEKEQEIKNYRFGGHPHALHEGHEKLEKAESILLGSIEGTQKRAKITLETAEKRRLRHATKYVLRHQKIEYAKARGANAKVRRAEAKRLKAFRHLPPPPTATP